MREIVLDTETTGLDPASGHRVVEIGAVEIVNKVATGRRFHTYLNPQRDMPDDAFHVHGLSEDFLADKPLFHTVVGEFLAFVEDAPLVIHNAEFDIRFLDHELTSAGHPPLGFSRAIDTLAIARRKHVGASNSLDSLCARYGISTTHRVLHGALLDAQLLADVYLELSGGMQSSFSLHVAADAAMALARNGLKARPAPLAIIIHADEQAAHDALVATLGTTALWQKFSQPATSSLN